MVIWQPIWQTYAYWLHTADNNSTKLKKRKIWKMRDSNCVLQFHPFSDFFLFSGFWFVVWSTIVGTLDHHSTLQIQSSNQIKSVYSICSDFPSHTLKATNSLFKLTSLFFVVFFSTRTCFIIFYDFACDPFGMAICVNSHLDLVTLVWR